MCVPSIHKRLECALIGRSQRVATTYERAKLKHTSHSLFEGSNRCYFPSSLFIATSSISSPPPVSLGKAARLLTPPPSYRLSVETHIAYLRHEHACVPQCGLWACLLYAMDLG